jgi:uncharacterized membrane protein YkoI
MRNQIVLGAVLLAGFTLLGGCAHTEAGDEKLIALEGTPPAVQAAINKVLAGRTADKIVTENEDGKTIYEVTYHVNGHEASADFTPVGEPIEQETDLEVSALPAAVSGAIVNKYPGSKIDEVAEVSSGGQKYYEAGVKLAGGGEHELQVNADGSIRADKTENGKKEEK